MDAAKRLTVERGAEGWTLAEVAEHAGMETEAVSDELASEWDVFEAVIRRDEVAFELLVAASVDRADAAGPRLLRLIEACVTEFDWTLWIELWSLALRDERARELRRELDENFRHAVAEVIERGCERGEFHVPDPNGTAIAIATLIDALAVQATLGDSTVSPNYMLDACAAVAGPLLGIKLSLRGQDDVSDG